MIATVLAFSACAAAPQSDGARLASAAREFKAACVSACAADEGAALSTTNTLPAQTVVYTTDEAVCNRMTGKLFCGRCPCTIVANESIVDLRTDTERMATLGTATPSTTNVTCSFAKRTDNVLVSCS